jgi:hypothetical protein
MESGAKRERNALRSWGGILGLARWIPQRDVRKLIWAHLNGDDREVVRCAHNSRRVPRFPQECRSYNERFVVRGHLALLQWSLRSVYSAPELCYVAVWHGHLEIVKWLTNQRRVWSSRMLYLAVEKGHLHILKWAISTENPCLPCLATYYAAVHGQLNILMWLHSIGCPLDTMVFSAAAVRGELETMKWLLSVGCPWDERVRLFARGEALQWALANGAP